MKSFKKHLLEAAAPKKNTHMTHIEDQVLYGGVEGARQAILALRSLRDMLSGSNNSSVDVSQKWDGAPAVFAGVDPRDGEFFVAKKGIFNKTPKVYKSHKDIDADTSGDLAKKLKIAYTELKKMDIKEVIQGDILFTQDDLKVKTFRVKDTSLFIQTRSYTRFLRILLTRRRSNQQRSESYFIRHTAENPLKQ